MISRREEIGDERKKGNNKSFLEDYKTKIREIREYLRKIYSLQNALDKETVVEKELEVKL